MNIDKKYLFGLLFAFILFQLIGGYTGRAFLIIAILLFICAIIQSILNKLFIKIEMDDKEGRIEVGDEGKFSINVTNKGLFTIPNVITHVLKSNDLRIFSVKPRSTQEINYSFTPKVRGTIDVGTIDVLYRDALNIITLKKSLKPSKLRVYPKVNGDKTDSLIYDTLGEGEYFRVFSKENPYLTREHRKYRPGDSLRRINWKVSAKANELLVKQGESTEDRDIIIILNMHRDIMEMDEEGIYENTLVTDALSLSQGLIKKDMPHGFILNDDREKYFFIDSMEAYQVLEEDLLETKSTFKVELNEFCEENSEIILERGTVIFFTKITKKDLSAMESLSNLHNEVIVMAPNVNEPYVDKETSQMHFIELKGEGYEMVKK